jgi:hypothetical protein
MIERSFLVYWLFVLVGCSHTHPPSCTVTCSTNADCSDGQTCSSLGRCTGTGTCSCTPSELLGCADATTAIACNSSGDGIASTACGSAGCNASAMRCNQCAPNAPVCEADGRTLDMCDATGIPQAIETCALGCVTAHCASIVPPYLPDVCDASAITATTTFSGGTIDPGLDMTCAAIVPQAGGPDVCVIRSGTISISGTLVVAGPTGSEPSRPIAFVADHDLSVDGTIVLSAIGPSPGAGGSVISSGVPGAISKGGGGAGSFTAGGNGADGNGGTGGLGGAAIAPPISIFAGGAGAGSCIGNQCTRAGTYTFGGGGGGGIFLVSCRGAVSVAGGVIASGGGGQGARLGVSAILPPSGGGAGGNVVIAGASVSVTGSFFANGGGGGGSCNNQVSTPCPGGDGGDGQSSTNVASGGTSSSNSPGGDGGTGVSIPGNGTTSGNIPPGPGGAGGGAAGHFQIYVPQGVTSTIAPAAASPTFDPTIVVQTR